MPRGAVRRRGFLLIETLAALVAASVFMASITALFSACGKLLEGSRAAVGREAAAARAAALMLAGEDFDEAENSETIYADGVELRRVTLKNPDGGEYVIVLPQKTLR